MTDTAPLRPAETAEIEQALAHALQFDGRKQFKLAKLTAAHLLECLERAGFVVMKRAGKRGIGHRHSAHRSPST
jgi:hypothetical protein